MSPREAALRPLRRAVLGAFLLSGAAGLMHEVVWSRLLVGLIGSTAHAQALVLAVFLGGLALGAAWLGRRVDGHGRPLRLYVALELLLAAYGLLLPLLTWAAGLAYVALAAPIFEVAGLKLILRLLLAVTVVLFPAVLMGGTLPVLARFLIAGVHETRRQVAGLYAVNSLGAVLGIGLAGFVTIPFLGLFGSLAVASTLNLSAGLWVLRRARDVPAETEDPPPRAARPERPAGGYGALQYSAALYALTLSGFAALGYEVVFQRVIALSFGASTYSFTVMLICFVAGISLGSGLLSRLPVRRPLWWLGVSQLLAVAALLSVTPLVARLPYFIARLRIDLHGAAGGFELYQLGKGALCLAVLLVPTVCLGFTFPLVAQIQARGPDDVGARVGSTYAWNTVGNVLGALGTGLVLLPLLGMRGAFHFNIALNVIAGAAVLLVAVEAPRLRRVAGLAAAVAVCGLYLSAGAEWSRSLTLLDNHLRIWEGPSPDLDDAERSRHPASSFAAWQEGVLVDSAKAWNFFLEEDAHANVLVYGGRDGALCLLINTKPDASTTLDLETQLLLGHVPLFLHPEARSVLVIGHGTGISAGAALRHPVERADIVEISRAVLDADPLFAPYNHQVLSDPRVRVYVEDGQSFLRTVPRTYDVIISEPSNPWVAGIGGLFTLEFFEDVRAKLSPDGLATIWFHEYEQSDASVELVLRTLASVFPYVEVFRDSQRFDLIVVASPEPIEPDFAAMERRFQRPEVADDLARIQVPNLAGFLSHHALSSSRLRRALPPGPYNTLNHPILEYRAPRSLFLNERSEFVTRHDPLVHDEEPETDLLLDRYIAYRDARRDPVSFAELVQAARHFSHHAAGRQAARAIRDRARRALGNAEVDARAAGAATAQPGGG